jgi:hypothetical protein
VSPELRDEVELELAMIRQHLDLFAALRRKVASVCPDDVEKAALGAMLHSFYNGVENIFKRVAAHCDAGPPRGEDWHTALLEQMTRPTPARPAVLSESLAAALKRFLEFRHVFRQAYGMQLRWDRMAPGVRQCQATFDHLEAELDAFLKAIEPKP